MNLKKCQFCKNNFETRYKKKNWCNDSKCILARKRQLYEADVRAKKCKCGKEFEGTRKSVACEECAYKAKHTANNPKELTIVDIICKRCGELQERKELLRDIYSDKIIKSFSLCRNCLQESIVNRSVNVKGELNPNYKPNKIVIKKETKLEMSERMKINNPMFRKEVTKKVSNTIKKKIKNGILKYKTGKEHHLYKGNRKRSFILRSRLKPWIKKWLEFYDYTCYGCKKRGGRLEVHHITPFRDVISKYTKNLESLSYEEFESISILIIDEHEKIEGIPVCKECHSKIDNFRKLKNE